MQIHWLVSTAIALTLVGATPHPKAHALAHAKRPTYESNPSQGDETETPSGDGGSGITLPPNCMKTSDGIAVGMQSVLGDFSRFGDAFPKSPCVWGFYGNINAQEDFVTPAKAGLEKANAADVIFMLSLQPNMPAEQIDVQTVVNSLKTLAGSVTKYPLWLRLGQEANTGRYNMNAQQYTALFQKVAAGVKQESLKIKMYWCPNGQNWGEIDSWYPGSQSVDIAGVDTYAMNVESRISDGLALSFCTTYAKHPIWIGESGLQPEDEHGVWNSAQGKTAVPWGKQMGCASFKQQCKSYLGFSWFEINDPDHGDFKGHLGEVKEGLSQGASC